MSQNDTRGNAAPTATAAPGGSAIRGGRGLRINSFSAAVMLLIAAAIEAFWSSATWLPHPVKYAVAAGCWIGVLGYLTFQGRSAD